MADRENFNIKIIDEFRSNGGKVGGMFQNSQLLLLHHRGAHSGVERVNPVAYQQLDDGEVAVFASKGGAPTNPAWYHNLLANPEVTVELGDETYPAKARVAEGEERNRIWTKQKLAQPAFAEYEANTTRKIPVVILERSS